MKLKIEQKLLAAFNRSKREAKRPVIACVTVAGTIQRAGKKYQVQVIVTANEDDWYDENLAGINPPNAPHKPCGTGDSQQSEASTK